MGHLQMNYSRANKIPPLLVTSAIKKSSASLFCHGWLNRQIWALQRAGTVLQMIWGKALRTVWEGHSEVVASLQHSPLSGRMEVIRRQREILHFWVPVADPVALMKALAYQSCPSLSNLERVGFAFLLLLLLVSVGRKLVFSFCFWVLKHTR